MKKMLEENPHLRESIKELLVDHLMILRQTKYNPETEQLLTKYVNVNTITATEPILKEVHQALEVFLIGFNGSFTKEWAMSVIKE